MFLCCCFPFFFFLIKYISWSFKSLFTFLYIFCLHSCFMYSLVDLLSLQSFAFKNTHFHIHRLQPYTLCILNYLILEWICGTWIPVIPLAHFSSNFLNLGCPTHPMITIWHSIERWATFVGSFIFQKSFHAPNFCW